MFLVAEELSQITEVTPGQREHPTSTAVTTSAVIPPPMATDEGESLEQKRRVSIRVEVSDQSTLTIPSTTLSESSSSETLMGECECVSYLGIYSKISL